MKKGWKYSLLLGTAFLVTAGAIAQFQGQGRGRGGGRGGGFGGGFGGEGGGRSYRASEVTTDRGNTPNWPLDEAFPHDVFTFARLRYRSTQREQSSYAWWTDYRDSDLNLSYRLQQLTAIKVNPDPVVVEISDPKLFDYPWIFMSGAGNITITDDEAKILRRYFMNGGFMMVDDYWGQDEWDGVDRAMKQIFPERQAVDIPRSHPIFHAVYDLPNDLSLQTPNIGHAIRNKFTGITWEDNHGGGNTRDNHFRGILDDKNRIMVFFCHNTDNGDGWEEETADPWFFSTFSEKKNFPLGINIIFYALTH